MFHVVSLALPGAPNVSFMNVAKLIRAVEYSPLSEIENSAVFMFGIIILILLDAFRDVQVY